MWGPGFEEPGPPRRAGPLMCVWFLGRFVGGILLQQKGGTVHWVFRVGYEGKSTTV